MDDTKNLGTLTEVHGRLTMPQMRRGFLGCGPGSNSVLLPESRNREHKPLPSQRESATAFHRFLPTLHLHVQSSVQCFTIQASIIKPFLTELFINTPSELTANQQTGK